MIGPLLILMSMVTRCSSPTGSVTLTPSADTTPPAVQGTVRSFDDSTAAALGSRIFLPGDSVHFEVRAQDDRDLRWVGFRLSGAVTAADSVPVADSLRTASVRVQFRYAPPVGLSGLVSFQGFARDSAGNLAEAALAGSPASFVVTVTTYVSQIGFSVADRGYAMDGPDGSRRFYWVSEAQSVGVSEDNARSTTVSLPGQGQDLDFTLNKDSLLVTLPTLDEYGIIDLGPTDPTLALVADTVTASADEPWLVRVLANGHALVFRRNATDTTTGSYVDWDVHAGTQTLVPGASVYGRMERTADRTRVVVWNVTACCAGRAQVYDEASGTFGAPATVGAAPGLGVTLDASGSHLLVGPNLFDLPQLDTVARFHLPGVAGPIALSQDGQTLFATTAIGELRVRVSDGVGYDLIDVGGPPPRLFATPDGGQLFMPFDLFVRFPNLPPLPSRSARPRLTFR